jgi:hypothetical protein
VVCKDNDAPSTRSEDNNDMAQVLLNSTTDPAQLLQKIKEWLASPEGKAAIARDRQGVEETISRLYASLRIDKSRLDKSISY